jgi:hypothetical protein
MILPPFFRLTAEDLPNAPTWVRPLISGLNSLADRLNIVFRGNIDFNNIASEERTITATSGTPVQVTLQVMKVQPTIVLPVYSAGQQFTVCITSYSSTGAPLVTVTNPTGPQTITVRFLP